MQYWAGWFDAATPEGAARRFLQMSNPMSVIIGPWPHGYDKPYDLLRPDDKEILPTPPTQLANVIRFANLSLNGQAAHQRGKVLHYYTLGEGAWKSTRSWPLPATRRRWYMASGFRLSSSPDGTGFDSLQVDPALGDVTSDRWTSSSRGQGGLWRSTTVRRRSPRLHERAADTRRRNHRTSRGLPEHHLHPRGRKLLRLPGSRKADESCYLTEGQLRALHRKVWGDSPFAALGPQHSCLKHGGAPLTPGEPAILTCALQPISARLPKGYRLRICLAGSNETRFAMVPADCAPPLLKFHRGEAGCYIDLPIIEP